MSTQKISFVFFGTPDFAVKVLDTLEAEGFVPSLVVTQEDKPQGRHLTLTPPPVKIWAEKHGVPCIQPKTLKDPDIYSKLKAKNYQLFVVAAYGKIIPKDILDIPAHKTLNIHPSLLPKFRGASPVQEAILKDERTGVTIIRLDEEVDHGPIIAQKEINFPEWPPYADEAELILAEEGGKLLASVLPDWVAGKVQEKEQDHSEATFTKKVEKVDAEIDLTESTEENLKKIRAYAGWPNAFTFYSTYGKNVRLIIKKAKIEDGKLVLERVVPEGKKEMSFKDFERGNS